MLLCPGSDSCDKSLCYRRLIEGVGFDRVTWSARMTQLGSNATRVAFCHYSSDCSRESYVCAQHCPIRRNLMRQRSTVRLDDVERADLSQCASVGWFRWRASCREFFVDMQLMTNNCKPLCLDRSWWFCRTGYDDFAGWWRNLTLGDVFHAFSLLWLFDHVKQKLNSVKNAGDVPDCRFSYNSKRGFDGAPRWGKFSTQIPIVVQTFYLHNL